MPFTRRWATGRGIEPRGLLPRSVWVTLIEDPSVTDADGLAQVKWNSVTRRPTAPGHLALAHFLAHKVLRRDKILSETET
jgi:hypothetical protein